MKPVGDYQATPLSDEALAKRVTDPAAAPAAAATMALDVVAPIARRTGIVLVHGIGNQGPADTFLEWSSAIIELLTAWRVGRDGELPPPSEGNRVLDPVRKAAFSFNAASPPYLEVTVPEVQLEDRTIEETTWVITEAWWAADIRPPNLGQAIDFLRRRLGTIASGITTGYRERSPLLAGLAVRDRPPTLSWRLIERLDWAQAKAFGARPVAFLVAAVGTAALITYDLVRRIPIPPIQDFAARKMIDSFLVEWFGDLPVLLDDPIQAANVRARLAESIKRLEDDGCDAIVVVAHSGGALVTFETLLDPAYQERRVDKLVTLGQALGLAWRLAADPEVHDITPAHRLVGDLARVRPTLRWVDVWASYDPAPAGPMPRRGGLVATAVDETTPADRPATPGAAAAVVETGRGLPAWLLRFDAGTSEAAIETAADQEGMSGGPHILVESRPVTNLMNVLNDHGGYWTNPEGFLVPLVRHLDAARGDAAESRFFRNKDRRTDRIVWRRQRVSVLAAWGWLGVLTATALLTIFTILTISGDHRLGPIGDRVAVAWSYVPGHELISGPIDGIGAIIDGMARAIGLGAVTAWLAEAGPGVLGAMTVLVTAFALIKVGTWRWGDWDRRERRAMLPEVPILPDRSVVAGQSLAILGGLVGFVLASFAMGVAAGIVIAVAWLAGGIVWFAGAFRSRTKPASVT